MIQGTTPTHTFNLSIDSSIISKLTITYAQFERVIVQKTKDDCVINNNLITVKLSQEDTLRFKPGTPVQIQLRVLTVGGDALASEISTIPLEAVLDKAVLK